MMICQECIEAAGAKLPQTFITEHGVCNECKIIKPCFNVAEPPLLGPSNRLHPDDMRFFCNLTEAIVIAAVGLREHDKLMNLQEAGGYILEARRMADERE